VTSKLQVTIPKAIADEYGIEPGVEVDWLPAGDAIRVVPRSEAVKRTDTERRIELFDRATERQRARHSGRRPTGESRGWSRDELYVRAGAG